MSVIRFEPNVAVEVALKYDGGKRVASRIENAPDQMMYTVCGDDTIYCPLNVAEQIANLGVKKNELISICKRQANNVTRWEVKRLSEAAEPVKTPFDALPTEINATPMERQLTTSINQVNQRKAEQALETPARLQNTQSSTPSIPNTPHSNPAPIAHTVVSRIMASALIAAFDATQECERYAHSKGVEMEFSTEDVRAISNTLFIQLAKDPGFVSAQKSNGGAQSWQQ